MVTCSKSHRSKWGPESRFVCLPGQLISTVETLRQTLMKEDALSTVCLCDAMFICSVILKDKQ